MAWEDAASAVGGLLLLILFCVCCVRCVRRWCCCGSGNHTTVNVISPPAHTSVPIIHMPTTNVYTHLPIDSRMPAHISQPVADIAVNMNPPSYESSVNDNNILVSADSAFKSSNDKQLLLKS